MSHLEDETGAEGTAPKGLGGGDSFPLRIGVSGCSTRGEIGSVLLSLPYPYSIVKCAPKSFQ